MTSTGLIPLNDLGTETYLGEEGGLYPGGSNVIPEAHLHLGRKLSRQVRPLNEVGVSGSTGQIGLISIGVSNTLVEFDRFIESVAEDPTVNPRLILVNGAQGARSLRSWAEGPEANPWFNLAVDVSRAGLTPEQVQVAWIKLPHADRGTVSLDNAGEEVDDLAEVVRIAKGLYPNLTLAYVSSRIYGGYGGSAESEPKAYQNGFAVKWLIARQIEGDPDLNADPDAGPVLAPWLAWGPYLWADGEIPRSDGLVWSCDDFSDDGIHPGPGGADKVAKLLFEHFSTHPTSSHWFLAGEAGNDLPGERTDRSATSDRRDRTSRDTAPSDRRGEGGAEPEAAPMMSDEVGWFVAGAVLGLGVSLNLVFLVTARRTRPRQDRPPEEL